MRLTSIEFSFDPCNIYRDSPRGVGYPADARSVGDSHPSCFILGHAPGRTPGWIFTVDGSKDAFSPKDVPFGGQNNES